MPLKSQKPLCEIETRRQTLAVCVGAWRRGAWRGYGAAAATKRCATPRLPHSPTRTTPFAALPPRLRCSSPAMCRCASGGKSTVSAPESCCSAQGTISTKVVPPVWSIRVSLFCRNAPLRISAVCEAYLHHSCYLYRFAGCMQPEAADDADAYLPPLLAALAAPAATQRTRETAAAALDACLTFLGDDTVPQYLDQLMPPLLAMLESAPVDMHDTVLSCCASAAAAAGQQFAPYARTLLPLLHRAMALRSGTGVRVRAVATDCAGAPLLDQNLTTRFATESNFRHDANHSIWI